MSKTSKSEAHLKQLTQSHLFSFMVDRIPDELIMIDSEARIVYVNQAAVKGLGFSRKKLLTMRITEFVKPRISVKKWQDQHFKAIKQKKTNEAFRVERKVKGKVQVIALHAIYFKHGDGEFLLTVGRNITQQIELQQDLKESVERYQLLTEAAGDSIITVSPKGHVTFMNQAALKLFRMSMKSVIGKHYRHLFAKSSLKDAQSCFKRAFDSGHDTHESLTVVNNKGLEIPVEIRITPHFEDGNVFQAEGVIRDIRKRLEVEQLMAESEHMKSIFNFVSGLAREIDSPLKTINRHTKRLVDNYKNREFEYVTYKEFRDIMSTTEKINTQVKYCSDTIQRLIMLNKRKAKVHLNQCQVNEIIKDTANAIEHQFGSVNTKIIMRLADKLPLAAIGSVEMSQIISNLVTNSLQAMPAGGRLRVRSSFQKEDKTILIIFEDEGVGIPKRNLPHVFDPFFTTRERGVDKSSGLGLSIVYSLVKAVKGDVEVKSSLRHGTVVRIILPIVEKGKS